MFRARGTSISLRDLRIAKLQKRIRFTPCGPELDAFLAAVAAHGGDEDSIPTGVKMALSRCMEASVSNANPRQQHCVCIYSHLSHFVSVDPLLYLYSLSCQREQLKGASVQYHVAKFVKRK